MALGLWLGLRRFAGDVAEPILVALYTIPKVTLYPVMLLVFGLGLSAKVAFGVIHGMVPIVLFTLGAVKTLPPVYLRTARALRLTAMQTGGRVLLPAGAARDHQRPAHRFLRHPARRADRRDVRLAARAWVFSSSTASASHNVRMTTAVTLLVILFAVGANGLLLLLDRRMQLPDRGLTCAAAWHTMGAG